MRDYLKRRLLVFMIVVLMSASLGMIPSLSGLSCVVVNAVGDTDFTFSLESFK